LETGSSLPSCRSQGFGSGIDELEDFDDSSDDDLLGCRRGDNLDDDFEVGSVGSDSDEEV